MDIRMYGVGQYTELVTTATGNERVDGDTMYAYFLFMNPYDIDDIAADSAKGASNVDVPYDGMLATLTYGTIGSANDFFATGEAVFTDIEC